MFKKQFEWIFLCYFQLIPLLSRDFVKEGWLFKKGPRQGDVYRRRWFSLDNRKLMYYEQPLVRTLLIIVGEFAVFISKG